MGSRLVSHRTPSVSRCMRRIDGQLLVSGAGMFWPLVDQLAGGLFVKLALRFFSVHIQLGQCICDRVIQRIGRGVRIVRIGATSRAHGWDSFSSSISNPHSGQFMFVFYSSPIVWRFPRSSKNAPNERTSSQAERYLVTLFQCCSVIESNAARYRGGTVAAGG